MEAYTMQAGWGSMENTYLTPLHYHGWHLGLDYRRYQAMKFSPDRWVMELAGMLGAAKGENAIHTAKMWDFSLNLSWGMMRKFTPWPNCSLGIGPGVDFNIGALYNPRGGNNPAQAKGAISLAAMGYAQYNWRIGKLPVTFTYRPTWDLLGAFFCPDYGELYYEIWLGDRSGLAHFGWPGNRFCLDNLLTADLKFGATWLRIGYHNRIYSSKANNIVSNAMTNAIVLGISGEFLSLSPKNKAHINSSIISPWD